MARLLEKYKNEVLGALQKKFGFNNINRVPRLEKIVINMGVGQAAQDKSLLDEAEKILAQISGQRPVRRLAKNAIAGFKIRKGYPVGCKVTLRGKRMFEFLDRLINIALPGVKDFRGLPNKFDGRGNYSLGRPDHTIFPEIDLDKVNNTYGMDICVVTTARNDEEGLALLQEIGFPFKKN